MLLEALLAATDRLLITYTGNDERTNARRPPAVPVGELLDMVERAGAPRDQVQICHPLQPFDPRNFTAGALADDVPWGYDHQSLAGARALTAPRTEPPPFLSQLLPPIEDPVIELDRLVRFVERPIRSLLRDRLGIIVRESFEEVEDALPVELDGLGKWGVGQRLLDGVLAGVDLDTCVRAEQARGLLPPGQLGIPVLRDIRDDVRRIADCAAEITGAAPASVDVNLALPDGRTLAGTVAGVCGDTLRVVSYSRVKPRERLRAWVRLLALTAAFPERPYESAVIGRARGDAYHADVTVVRVRPLGDAPGARHATALRHLEVLIDLYDRGMREVLPLTSDASAAYAEALAAGGNGTAAAGKAWKSSFDRDREDREPEHRRVFGGEVDFDVLLDDPPRLDESGPGWEDSERTRFGRYARRLWDGLLAVEEFSDR
jgi:exodeoxyribonuclease V gamma subunit